MKTYAHHDLNGNIKSVINYDGPAASGLMLTPKAGEFVSELEEVRFASKKPDHKELEEIATSYKVVTPHSKSRIQKK